MITITCAQLAEIVGGRATSSVSPEAVITSVTTDSREVRDGGLFVAKPGESSDGHLFIGQALAAGAVVALAERETTDADGAVHPAILVDDVVDAMGVLAAWVVAHVRERGELTVVGITGSAGKTTTKDLVAAVLETQGATVKPQGSYNGEVGLPLTVFEMTEDTRYLVAEMGATHVGNITYLADIVRPDVGVVLMVGTAHVGEFGGVENIVATKGELVEALSPQGTAVLNADDGAVWGMRERTSAAVLPFGESEHAAGGVRALQIRTDEQGHPLLTLAVGEEGRSIELRSGLIGRHHASNVMAAVAACLALGVDLDTIVTTLQDRGPGSRHRMERTERPDGVSVINDAYNANPESMLAALQTLAALGRPDELGNSRRTWAVLGEMLDLGDERVAEHDRLGRLVVRMNIDKTLVVGLGAKPAYNAAVMEGSWGDEASYVESLEEAREFLAQRLLPGDIVLFKSSNGSGLRVLGDQVAADAASDADPTTEV